jgi:hypothetical protein
MIKPIKYRSRFSRRELGRFVIVGGLIANEPTFGSAAQRRVN